MSFVVMGSHWQQITVNNRTKSAKSVYAEKHSDDSAKWSIIK